MRYGKHPNYLYANAEPPWLTDIVGITTVNGTGRRKPTIANGVVTVLIQGIVYGVSLVLLARLCRKIIALRERN